MAKALTVAAVWGVIAFLGRFYLDANLLYTSKVVDLWISLRGFKVDTKERTRYENIIHWAWNINYLARVELIQYKSISDFRGVQGTR